MCARRFLSACLVVLAVGPFAAGAADPVKPNILWITCEDMSADLGCYGDEYSRSPAIDRLAADGVRYTRCFTHVGVCAPSRSGLITGMYPPSIGTQHMRSTAVLPPYVKCYSELLRDAGYYCTNNSKTDYNFAVPKEAWDENGGKAHWKNRPAGKPFFAIFNLQITHESQIRAPEKVYQNNTKRLTAEQRHDPATAPLPPYFPDTPIVRQDVARYYDNITAMDYQVADLLRELDDAGLADDTIVFFYSDHGAGLPRSKRWLYDSSLHVPLIVRYPKKWQTEATTAGTVNEELVAFVDLGPTVLSLAGAEIPKHMQGQAFLGPLKSPTPRKYVYGCRDRMDERVDMIRSVRDHRFQYIRNYQWWKPYAQNINYMNEMPTMQEWRRLSAEGKLNPAQALFMASQKPREELYDCDADPHEVKNLAEDPEYADVLARMRAEHERWNSEIHDLGFLPESSMQTFMKTGGSWRENQEMRYAMQRIQALWRVQFDSAWAANNDPESIIKELFAARHSRDLGPGVTAYRIRAVEFLGNVYADRPSSHDLVLIALRANELPVRTAAAEALVKLRRRPSQPIDEATLGAVRPIYAEALKSDNPYVRHAAALAVDDLGPQAAEFLDDVQAMLKIDTGYAARVGEYILSTRGGGPLKKRK
jgi:uncharacterized sulfatase